MVDLPQSLCNDPLIETREIRYLKFLLVCYIYTGRVMSSFYYASTPARGNWFQPKQSDHESDDHAGDTITSLCILPMTKDMALQR